MLIFAGQSGQYTHCACHFTNNVLLFTHICVMRRLWYPWVTQGNRIIVSQVFPLCPLTAITSVLEMFCVMCLALLYVEVPDGDGIGHARHSGPRFPLPSVTVTTGCPASSFHVTVHSSILPFSSVPGRARPGWIPWEAWRARSTGRWVLGFVGHVLCDRNECTLALTSASFLFSGGNSSARSRPQLC